MESALLDLPLVNACTVLAHGDEGSEKYLVAYVVPNEQVCTMSYLFLNVLPYTFMIHESQYFLYFLAAGILLGLI